MHASHARTRTHPEGIYRRRGDDPIEREVLPRAYCAIGDADHVTDELLELRTTGFDGLVLNFVNYLDELPYFAQEVSPRLERAGVCAAITAS